jgi:hypothetical protein
LPVVAAAAPHLHAVDAAVVLQQAHGLGVGPQLEAGVAPRLVAHEVQELPLRHQHQELAVRGQVGEVGHGEAAAFEGGAQLVHAVVRALQEGVEQAQLVQHLERGRVHGVPAKVAQEVEVLLQHDHAHAGAREQQAEHHAGRAAARDAAAWRGVHCVDSVLSLELKGRWWRLARFMRVGPQALNSGAASEAFGFPVFGFPITQSHAPRPRGPTDARRRPRGKTLRVQYWRHPPCTASAATWCGWSWPWSAHSRSAPWP